MKNETKTNMNALWEQPESGGDKVCLLVWYGQSYDASSWWTAEERRKRPDEHSLDEGRQSRKKQELTATRWWVFIEFGFVCLVFRGDLVCVISQGISRYIVASCPVSCDITRYGISRYRIISRIFGSDMEISYPVDFFLDTQHYFLTGAPSLVHQESKRNGYWAIELQKQWHFLESVPFEKLQVFMCGYIDRSCVTGTRLCNMFSSRRLFVAVKPVVPALCVSPEHVWRQFFHHLALSLTVTRTTITNWNYDIS